MAGSIHESFEDIQRRLDTTKAEHFRKHAEFRAPCGSGFSYTGDNVKHISLSKPTKQEALQRMSDRRRPFCSVPNATIGVNGCFGEQKFIRPKVLDTWTLARLVIPEPKAHGRMQIKSRSVPDFYPTPTDDLCGPHHRAWLEKHHAVRDKETHPEYHSLLLVDKAQGRVDHFLKKKQITRELLARNFTRGSAGAPQLSENATRSLQKVRQKVATARSFRSAIDVDPVAQEEHDLRQALETAKSAPALRGRPETPPLRARHLCSWQGPDRNINGSFRETTPWRESDARLQVTLSRKARQQAMP